MNYLKLLLCFEVCTSVIGVKVNMQGSLRLGKDVVETLSHFVGQKYLFGRRSFVPAPIEDPITLAVKSALLCKDVKFCQQQQHFINEYVTVLAKAVESVLSSPEPKFNNELYENQLKYVLEFVRKILEDANTNFEEGYVEYFWTKAIKRINAKLQEMSSIFIEKYDKKRKRDLQHNIVIATAFIERKYELKLCSDHEICSENQECTRTLNKLLIHFKTLSEDKVRSFIKHFYDALFGSSFYKHLNPATAHEFQVILNDLSYSNDTPIRDLLLSVQKTLEARLDITESKKAQQVSHDVLIAHVILSDVDHMFSDRIDPFIMFLNQFYDWLASDVKIEKQMRNIISDISNQIISSEKDLVHKLVKEVNVFLEMTVGPDQ